MRAKQFINEDWQKVNKQDKTDGMSDKAVKAYRRENPGSKLKTAVTKKPSELKKGSKDANRRKSFCARMSGMKKAHASAKTKRDPDSPINKALRRWNCESIEQLEQALAEAALGVNPKRPSRPGSRPDRGHTAQPRYKKDAGISKDKETAFHAKLDKLVHNTFGKRDDEMEEDGVGKTHISPSGVKTNMPPTDDDYAINYGKNGLVAKDRKSRGVDVKTGQHKVDEQFCEVCGGTIWGSIAEHGKASRELCKSSKPDSELGASMLASCKSQGLRARDGDKSHKLGKSPKSRVKVGGHKIKGKKYGGPLPDWS